MLKKNIKYENIDGEEVSEDFYFSYTTAELAEMQLVKGGGMESYLQNILKSNDAEQIMGEFKKLIGGAVGTRTPQGKFIKNKQFTEEFLSSDAYSELFMGFMNEKDSIIEFVRGIVPKKLSEQVAALPNTTQTVELPNSGIIEGVTGDAAAQASKPQPHFPESTPFPQSMEAAIIANQKDERREVSRINSVSGQSNDDPLWLREMRLPTRQEMMKMSKEELQFAFKMKESGVLS